MQGVYDSLSIVILLVAFGMFCFLFYITKDRISANVKKRKKDRNIRTARRTIERYSPESVLTDTEIKSIVVDFLTENNLIATGDYKHGRNA